MAYNKKFQKYVQKFIVIGMQKIVLQRNRINLFHLHPQFNCDSEEWMNHSNYY